MTTGTQMCTSLSHSCPGEQLGMYVPYFWKVLTTFRKMKKSHFVQLQIITRANVMTMKLSACSFGTMSAKSFIAMSFN
jgi:hypothetical protein